MFGFTKKTRRRTAGAILAAATLFSFLFASSVSADGERQSDHILVKLAPDADPAVSLDLPGGAGYEALTEAADGMWYRIDLLPGTDADLAVRRALLLPGVADAEQDGSCEGDLFGSGLYADAEGPSYEGTLARLPEAVRGNPGADHQWYLESVTDAWGKLEQAGIGGGGSRDVVVAVIDVGVDYTHPDLFPNMWINEAEIPGNGIDDDGNGYADDIFGVNLLERNSGPYSIRGDANDHGTHVAGIIAAANNDIGTVGIAYNARIMAIRAMTAYRADFSRLAQAVEYARKMGADVINMSFGSDQRSKIFEDALFLASQSAVLVAAAGNEFSMMAVGKNPAEARREVYPAAYPFVVGVMATNFAGKETDFTNYVNKEADKGAYTYNIYAPGEDIYSTMPDAKYEYESGTSMASPYVAGVAALLRSYYDREKYTAADIVKALLGGAAEAPGCIGGAAYHPAKHYRPGTVSAAGAMEFVFPVPGDVNSDGRLSLRDVALVIRYLVGYKLEQFDVVRADFDDNGRVNAKDAAMMIRAITG